MYFLMATNDEPFLSFKPSIAALTITEEDGFPDFAAAGFFALGLVAFAEVLAADILIFDYSNTTEAITARSDFIYPICPMKPLECSEN